MTMTTTTSSTSTSSSTSGSGGIINSSHPTTTTLRMVIHNGLIQLTNHPTTIVLGGMVMYVIGGFTLTTRDTKQRKVYFKPVTTLFGVSLTIYGFVSSIVRDIQDAISDGRTQHWKTALDGLKQFLIDSQLDVEFHDTMSSSHFLASTIFLTDIQNKTQTQRRQHLQIDEYDDNNTKKSKETEIQTLLNDGDRYMRFATCVYGEEMIAAAELAVLGKSIITPHDTHEIIIKKHCRLLAVVVNDDDDVDVKMMTDVRMMMTDGNKEEEEEEVVVDGRNEQQHHQDDNDNDNDAEVWCDYDYDFSTSKHPHAQNCMVVYCHQTKELVLSIRGTFSISGIITDLAGYCEPFGDNGGQAHSGMALAAKDTWYTVWNQIIRPKLKEEGKDVEKFVITGHSLGAGVACLVTILIYDMKLEELQKNTTSIKCYAMAPPPVFCPLDAAPEAVANTVAYIHNWDIVPSLSVDSVRRLMACLSRIVNVLKHHPLWDLAAKRWKLGNEPNQELLDAYKHPKETFRVVDKAPMLLIPASKIVWMEKDPSENHDGTKEGYEKDEIFYETKLLDPTKYAERVLDLELPDCVADHMADCYELAFDTLLKKK